MLLFRDDVWEDCGDDAGCFGRPSGVAGGLVDQQPDEWEHKAMTTNGLCFWGMGKGKGERDKCCQAINDMPNKKGRGNQLLLRGFLVCGA